VPGQKKKRQEWSQEEHDRQLAHHAKVEAIRAAKAAGVPYQEP
jgi:hypothetical protein